MEHIRKGVATWASRLVDDHYFRSVDSCRRRSRWLTIALDEVSHQFSIQLVHNVICDLTAVVVAFVNDRTFFILLSVVVTSERCITGTRGIREPDISQTTIGELINETSVVFYPRTSSQSIIVCNWNNRNHA